MSETDIAVIEAVFGSDLYRQSLRLREAILRAPLGLTLTQQELADDVTRQHFCAIFQGIAVGTVSLKPVDEATLQLKQMAVSGGPAAGEDRRAAPDARGRLGSRRGFPPHGAPCPDRRRRLLCQVRLSGRREALRGEHRSPCQNVQTAGLRRKAVRSGAGFPARPCCTPARRDPSFRSRQPPRRCSSESPGAGDRGRRQCAPPHRAG